MESNLKDTLEDTKRTKSSLLGLTQRFMYLLQNVHKGRIDLKQVAESLCVQKRRIYDITNVLEGIGLISKKCYGSQIEWRGNGESPVKHDETLKLLKEDQEILIKKEEALNKEIKYAMQSLHNVQDDPFNKSFAYITSDDLINYSDDDTIIIINNFSTFRRPVLEINGIAIRNRILQVISDGGSIIDARLVLNECKATCNHALENNFGNNFEDNLQKITEVYDVYEKPKRRRIKSRKLLIAEKSAKMKINLENEREIIASILLADPAEKFSKRADYYNDLDDEYHLLQLNPPQNDFYYSLSNGEGVCELFDINLLSP